MCRFPLLLPFTAASATVAADAGFRAASWRVRRHLAVQHELTGSVRIPLDPRPRADVGNKESYIIIAEVWNDKLYFSYRQRKLPKET